MAQALAVLIKILGISFMLIAVGFNGAILAGFGLAGWFYNNDPVSIVRWLALAGYVASAVYVTAVFAAWGKVFPLAAMFVFSTLAVAWATRH